MTRATPDDVITISDFAHIDNVEVSFGDLTVLVGPQASGKSLVLQMLKLAIDGHVISATMNKYGLVFKDSTQFLARYFGMGLENAWIDGKTAVSWAGREIKLGSLHRYLHRSGPLVYYVPAHRTLTLADGYPPTFQQFRPETPFVVRQFSEELRQVLIEGMGQEILFPQAKRLKSNVRDRINDAVFHGAELRGDASGLQRQLKLQYGDATSLSYMTWTAGQREFIPLLLGLYYLLPAGRYSKRAGTDWGGQVAAARFLAGYVGKRLGGISLAAIDRGHDSFFGQAAQDRLGAFGRDSIDCELLVSLHGVGGFLEPGVVGSIVVRGLVSPFLRLSASRRRSI